MAAVRTLVVDVYIGHPSPPGAAAAAAPLEAEAQADDPAAPLPAWRWYGIQLPVLLRPALAQAGDPACDLSTLPHMPLPRGTTGARLSYQARGAAGDAAAGDAAPEAGAADAALDQLTAEIPCSLHYHAIMPSLGQDVSLFGVHLEQTPVILMGVAPIPAPAPAPPPPPTPSPEPPAATTPAAVPPATVPPPPGAHRLQATPLARVLPASGGGGAGGWAGGPPDGAHSQEAAFDSEDEGESALERAISKLVRTKRNKYVQKKSASAWRIEPHLPREIAGAASDAIGRTRLSGYGWIKTAITGGIFRELLVCSSGERWWSCIPMDMLARCDPPAPPPLVCMTPSRWLFP